MAHEEMFKGFLIFKIWQPFCSMDQNNLYNLCRGYGVKQILLNYLHFGQWFTRGNCKCFPF